MKATAWNADEGEVQSLGADWTSMAWQQIMLPLQMETG